MALRSGEGAGRVSREGNFDRFVGFRNSPYRDGHIPLENGVIVEKGGVSQETIAKGKAVQLSKKIVLHV